MLRALWQRGHVPSEGMKHTCINSLTGLRMAEEIGKKPVTIKVLAPNSAGKEIAPTPPSP